MGCRSVGDAQRKGVHRWISISLLLSWDCFYHLVGYRHRKKGLGILLPDEAGLEEILVQLESGMRVRRHIKLE